MKLEHKEFGFDNFAAEMTSLHDEKHFDYLVTIIGEDFGEEGLGCIYILENTKTHERISVKQMAKKVGEEYVIPTVCDLWKIANLLEREVYDFYGIKFLGCLLYTSLLSHQAHNHDYELNSCSFQ